MGLKAECRWKEELIVIDEEGRSFCFETGWGANPPVAYLQGLVVFYHLNQPFDSPRIAQEMAL